MAFFNVMILSIYLPLVLYVFKFNYSTLKKMKNNIKVQRAILNITKEELAKRIGVLRINC